MKKFRIKYVVDCILTQDEIWPDNDGPENPTTSDVLTVLEDAGRPTEVIEEWNLTDRKNTFTVDEA